MTRAMHEGMFSPTLVHDFLSRSAALHPEKEALVSCGERWTYAALDDASGRLAASLTGIGLVRGDRVVVFMDNSPETVVSIYGVLKGGGVFVVPSGSMKPGKLAYILKDSGARVFITHTDKRAVATAALEGLAVRPRTIWAGAPSEIPAAMAAGSLTWDEAVRGPAAACPARGSIDRDLAALIYTSGSTGEPKGVMSSHHNMVSAARSIIEYIGNRSDDVVVDVLPLSFDYGLYQLLMTFMFGGTLILERSFAYPVKVLEKMAEERVTGFPIVPTMAAFLTGMSNIGGFDLGSLRYITNTAAALPVDHIRRLAAIFPQARIFSMYGLTECKRVSYLPPEELGRRPSSVGKAIPNSEVFVVDEQGCEVAPGVVGELVVRGANVMQGYWNSPELTSRTFRQGRYPWEKVLYSGDLFRKDEDGFLYFVGRKDDMIKTKGERVSPREVENALCSIEGVREAAVVGVPDDILGQAVKAFVVCGPGVKLAEKDIKGHCARELEPFMVPKHVVFMEGLPRTANGKVDKKLLAQ